MERYALYLRKSRADMEAEARGEGETLARHQKTLLSLARKLGIHIVEIYREIVSGETIVARPVMQKLLTEVEQGMWNGILVMEVERLARGDTMDQGLVAQTFKYSNTKIITPTKTYDPSNEFDEEYFEFSLFMARREFKTINRRLQAGRIASLKDGKFIYSVAPFGYNKVPLKNNSGFTLEPHPDESQIVKLIFELYTVGDLQPDGTYIKLGASLIAEKLDQMGIKSRIKGTWNKSSIIDILKNHAYIGKIRHGFRKEVKSIENGNITIKRPYNSEYHIYDGLHPAIIDEEVFHIAQKIMNNRSHPPVPGSNILKNPFTGLAVCGKCNTMLTRLTPSNKTPYATIKCPNKHCTNVSAPLYLVESTLIEELKNWLSDFEVTWQKEKGNTPYSKSIKQKEKELEFLISIKQKAIIQQEKIYTLLEEGVYTVEIFKERNEKVSKELNDINSNYYEKEKELQELKMQAYHNEVFIPNAEHLLDIYFNLDNAQVKNDALREIIVKFEYIKDKPNPKGEKDIANFKLRIYPNVITF